MKPDETETLHRAAERGVVFAYFGYGSLVNRETHRTAILGAARASVRGWRRHWQGRPHHVDDPISLLSVRAEPDAGHELPGLLVFDRIENIAALDEREFNYHRRTIAAEAITTAVEIPSGVPVYIYEGKAEIAPDTGHAILQSYLDAVLKGYLLEYGETAVGDFIRSTHAFDSTPVIRDRNAPRYMRSVDLSDDLAAFFDGLLSEHGVVFRE